jgi:predicted O-methyltransferase YrrM
MSIARKPAITTQIKVGLNTLLNTAGLQLNTTTAERAEKARLKKLLARGHWNDAPFTEGLTLDAEQHLAFLQSVCAPYRSELEALPVDDAAGNGYFRNNEWFGSIDGDVLYGIIRHFVPEQILEIGSGFSSRLAARAIRDGELKTKLTCVDPHPRVEIEQCADEFIQGAVEDLPASELASRLNAGDVLFIDSSHLITTGGDIQYLYLQLLPRLCAGVLIHAHDIFLPFDYPEELVRKRWAWNEQYLLHALLIGNAGFEILWPSYHVWRLDREKVEAIIGSQKFSSLGPSSFWMVKR